MDNFDFDTVVDRRGSRSLKWDGLQSVFHADGLLPMWVADMDFRAPPAVCEAIGERVRHGIFGYPFRWDSLFQSVLDWESRRFGWELRRDWLCFTPGVMPTLALVLQAFTLPGEGVIVQTPAYNMFSPVILNNGRRFVSNPLHWEQGCWRMDLEDLKKKLDHRTRLIVLCSPHNPVGRVWERSELEALAEICLGRDILILSDEIHCDIVYRGHRHLPLATLGAEVAKHSITCIAPSKTFNVAGLTTSVVILPDPALRRRFQNALEAFALEMGNVLGLIALEACYRHGEEWLEALLCYLEGNLELLEGFLAQRLPKVRWTRPEGTYLAWLDFRELVLPQSELDRRLIQSGLALSSGPLYGSEGEGFERLNFACPRVLLEEGLSRLEAALGDVATTISPTKES